MEKKTICEGVEITKIIAGDFKKISAVIKNKKFQHIDKNGRLGENDLISFNPNMLFEIAKSGDEETLQLVEAVSILAVGREVKKYIMSAFLTRALCDIICVHAEAGETDEESGRTYSEEEFSYRIDNVVLPILNPLLKRMILSDVQNQTILEPKKTVSAPNVFTMNQSVVL